VVPAQTAAARSAVGADNDKVGPERFFKRGKAFFQGINTRFADQLSYIEYLNLR
jgi:hypothetical protein